MSHSSLKEVIEGIRNYPGLSRKAPIRQVVSRLPYVPNAYFDLDLVAGLGDDSAAFRLTGASEEDDAPVYLLAADGIMQSLIDKDPYWAGYSSVLVNVNDIAAMGGLPLAMVNVLSTRSQGTMTEVLRGIANGCFKFGLAMVGGHTHPDGDADSLAVSILGLAKKGCIITSHGAQAGDALILAFDMDGRITPGIPYSWDTTSHKTPAQVQAQVKALNVLGELKVVTAGKDLSNPGMLGTAGMLLETSGKGAVIDLDRIPTPAGLEFTHWLTVYQGCGFVLTCPDGNVKIVTELLEEAGLSVTVCGQVDAGRELVLERAGEREVLFDFSKDLITGVVGKDING